jgi:hypothetical protein
MTNGKWQMADGKWQMADGRWQMADGKLVHWFAVRGAGLGEIIERMTRL